MVLGFLHLVVWIALRLRFPTRGTGVFVLPVAVWVGVFFAACICVLFRRLGEAEELGGGFADGFGVGW